MDKRCGQGRYRDEPCVPELKHTKKQTGTRSYMCTTHQQWIYDSPASVTITFKYDDGTEVTDVRPYL
jgi:hypothetical protein